MSKGRRNRPRRPKRRPSEGLRSRDVTFSWVYPIVLTYRCSYNCGYCPFPVTAGPPLPSKSAVQQRVARARRLGISQVRLTAGEGLENHPDIVSTFKFYGYSNFTDYLKGLIEEVASNGIAPALFPEIDLGALSLFQMQRLRPHIFTLRLFLESMDSDLQYSVAHAGSEAKWPRNRLKALLAAAQLGIPVNSGLMVGIGESVESRTKTLQTLAQIASRHGHIQSVSIQPFIPQARTAMSHLPAPSPETLIEVAAEARKLLPDSVVIQFPIVNCPERVMDFIEAGVGDLGDFDLTGDARADAASINAFKIVSEKLGSAGIKLSDRLSLFPRFSSEQWTTPYYQDLLRNLQSAGPAPGGETQARAQTKNHSKPAGKATTKSSPEKAAR